MDEVVFNHVGLCVTDLGRSQRFYEEALGFVPERELSVPDEPADRLLQLEAPLGITAVYLRNGGFVLELLHYDRPDNPPARSRAMNEPGLTHISVTVQDMDAALDAVKDRGGEVLDDTNVGPAIFVKDPDGQLIELLTR